MAHRARPSGCWSPKEKDLRACRSKVFDCDGMRFRIEHYSFFSAGASPSFFSAGASPSFFSAGASPSFFSAGASPSFFSPASAGAAASPPGGTPAFVSGIIPFVSGMAGGGFTVPPPPAPPSPQPIANASKPHPRNIARFFIVIPLLSEVLRRPTRRRPAVDSLWLLRDQHKIHSPL